MLILTPPLLSAAALLPASLLVALVMLLKITCVLLLALAVAGTMPRASAGARHLVWLVALAALLLLPPLAVWAPLPLRVLPATTVSSEQSLPTGPATSTALQVNRAVQGEPETVPSGPSDNEVRPATTLSFGTLLVFLWATGVVVLLGRLAYGAWSVRRIVRRAAPLVHPSWQTPLYEIADRLGLEAAPALLRSEDVKMPFAAGLFTSTIVLPAESDDWSGERRSAVLVHELSHVRRRDLVGHTVSRIACALYWFHPLVWTAARRLRAESERACDDLALVFGARPSDYAEHLLEIVTCVRDHNTPAVALAMAHRKEFEGRMLAILNPELRRRGPSRTEALSLAGSLAALALLVGAAAPMPRVATAAVVADTAGEKALGFMRDAGRAPVSMPASPAAPETVARRVPSAEPAPNPRPMPAPRPTVAAEAVLNAATGSDQEPDDTRAAVLAKALRTDANAGVRRTAAWGLARYARTEVAVGALTSALDGDTEATVREMAAWALAGARRNSTAGAAVMRALEKDRDASVRATASWAAGSIGDPAVVPALVARLKDSEAEVRELAAWSIGACRPDQAPSALVDALGDKDRDVRESVTWALFTIHDQGTAAAIEAAFRRETDAGVREGMIKALGRMGDASVDVLQRLVASPDSQVRAVAITALAGGDASGPWPWPRPEPRPFP